MSATAIPSTPEQQPAKKGPRFPVPRTIAGGIAEPLDLDTLMEASAEREEQWKDYPGRYYFSKIGNCFRKEWYLGMGLLPDDGVADMNSPDSAYRFDPGKFIPGHAVENHIRLLMETVYTKGKPGVVLKDVRISEAIDVEYEKDGKTVSETIHVIGKTDTMVLGDNMEVLEFDEIKTPIYWPAKHKRTIEQFGKIVPLSLIGIEDSIGKPDGSVNINNAMQLAVGVHILRQQGIKIRQVKLMFINRERYREHVAVLFSPEDIEYLHNVSVAWVMQHHEDLQSKTPPAANFFMGYECKYCPFAARCTAENKKSGGVRKLHPAVIGINDRLAEVNGHAPPPAAMKLIEALEGTLASAKKRSKRPSAKKIDTLKIDQDNDLDDGLNG